MINQIYRDNDGKVQVRKGKLNDIFPNGDYKKPRELENELIKLKKQQKDLWQRNGWSCKWWNEETEEEYNEVDEKIQDIEKQNIYCTCERCGSKNDTVTYYQINPDELMCVDCEDEGRSFIKDKFGL